jgi:hypothetical protein
MPDGQAFYFQKNVPVPVALKTKLSDFLPFSKNCRHFHILKMRKRKFLFMKVVRFLAYLFSSELYYSTHSSVRGLLDVPFEEY